MKSALIFLIFTGLSASLNAYTKDPDSGLIFNVTKAEPTERTGSPDFHGIKSALWVAPDDLPARQHHSNSSMARLELHVFAPKGSIGPHQIGDDGCEQIFIVLEGELEVVAGGEKLVAVRHDIVFIPPGLQRSLTARGDQGARVLQADWREKGILPAGEGTAFIVSETRRPLEATGGEGYVTVMPNSRQQGNALSIVSYGDGHIKASNSLLLYPHDIESARPFKANTRIARMGLSAYQPGGGTRWHFHPDREQCFVVLKGNGLVEVGANTVEVKEGDIVFSPRHVGHGYRTTGDETFMFLELEWGRD
jgi:quercetin dioxygenase-like cupin family protein